MKKQLKAAGTIMAFCMMVCIMCMGKTMQVQAATEKTLLLNQTYTETFTDSDAKIYAFKVTEAGYFTVSVKNVDQDDTNWAQASVYDSDNKEIITERYGNSITLPVYATGANQTYYLKLIKYLGARNQIYEFKVDFQKADNWETEKNDSANQADAIAAKKEYYGTISYHDEYDFYKFTVKQDSKVKIKFGAAEVDGESYRWNVSLLNEQNQSYDFYSGNTTETYTCYLKKGTYYIGVNNLISATDYKYKLSYTASKMSIKTPKITSVSGKVFDSWFGEDYTTLSSIKIKNGGDVAGYTVRVAKKSNMRGTLMKEDFDFGIYASKSKVTPSNRLKLAKKYYIQARGYVNDPFGERIYGKYSKAYGKTIKK